jgi:hypothetical protein
MFVQVQSAVLTEPVALETVLGLALSKMLQKSVVPDSCAAPAVSVSSLVFVFPMVIAKTTVLTASPLFVSWAMQLVFLSSRMEIPSLLIPIKMTFSRMGWMGHATVNHKLIAKLQFAVLRIICVEFQKAVIALLLLLPTRADLSIVVI